MTCEYDRVPDTTEQVQGQSPPTPPAPLLLRWSPELLDDAYWGLRAFHHFAVNTSETLPGSHIPSVKNCWTVQVPILALSHKPLRNEVVALAALHLSTQGCQDDELLACRASSLDAALQTYRPALGEIGPETADAACFTAILLLVDAFAVLQYRELVPYEPPMQWLRLARGARTVFEASYPLVKASSSSIMTIIASSPDEPGLDAGANIMQTFVHLLQPCHGEKKQLQPVADIYERTALYLSAIQAAVMSHEGPLALCRRLMSFPCLVPPLFLDLVEQKEPRALAMIGHLFALSSHIKNLWWVGSTPSREVHAIRAYLPPELQHLMALPCRLVDVNSQSK